MEIQFRDLQRQYENIKDAVDERIADVISSAHFISGPEVKEIEKLLADYVGVRHCITCANGTDAISIALMANGVGRGDAVFVPDFTFFSSGECPAMVGATPIFVDVSKKTYNIDASSLENAIKRILDEGQLKPRAVIAVDLFGQPFEVPAVRAICDKYNLLLLEDGAQGFGGYYKDANSDKKMACSIGDIATTSFFPAKPLGCYGDGGAIFTDDDDIALKCRSIAVHGKDTQNLDDPNAKYNNIRLGMNSRLDTLQAGVLLAKFFVFKDKELDAVNRVAAKYNEMLGTVEQLTVPVIESDYYSSWAQYTVQLADGIDRAELQRKLKADGIPTNIYYIMPMHKQRAFAGTVSAYAECPNTEKLCDRVICLPIHPYMEMDEVEYICEKIRSFLVQS